MGSAVATSATFATTFTHCTAHLGTMRRCCRDVQGLQRRQHFVLFEAVQAERRRRSGQRGRTTQVRVQIGRRGGVHGTPAVRRIHQIHRLHMDVDWSIGVVW